MSEKGTYSDPRCYACAPNRECATRLHNCGATSCDPEKGGCFLLRQQGWHWDAAKRELVKDVTATVTVKHYRTSGREPDIDNAMTVTIPEWLVKGAANPEGWREVDGVALPPITWAEKEAEIERHFPHWSEGKKAEARASLGPKPYHTGRLEGSYNRFADRIAEAINKRIPGPDVNNDVLRKARSE